MGSDNCHPNATCLNTDGSYTCLCNVGFTGDGSTCTGIIRNKMYSEISVYSFLVDIDECEQESLNECDVNANCSNTVGSYSCFCLSGFEGNGFNCSGVSLSVDRKGKCYLHC